MGPYCLLSQRYSTLSGLPGPGTAHLPGHLGGKFFRGGFSDSSQGTLGEQSSGEISVPTLLSCYITTTTPRTSWAGALSVLFANRALLGTDRTDGLSLK